MSQLNYDNPTELSQELMRLAFGEMVELADELEKILEKKANDWERVREMVNSDAKANRIWEATDEGRKEDHLRRRIKIVEKQMSAIKTRINVKELEVKGMF